MKRAREADAKALSQAGDVLELTKEVAVSRVEAVVPASEVVGSWLAGGSLF